MTTIFDDESEIIYTFKELQLYDSYPQITTKQAECNKCQKRDKIKYCGTLEEEEIYLTLVV